MTEGATAHPGGEHGALMEALASCRHRLPQPRHPSVASEDPRSRRAPGRDRLRGALHAVRPPCDTVGHGPGEAARDWHRGRRRRLGLPARRPELRPGHAPAGRRGLGRCSRSAGADPYRPASRRSVAHGAHRPPVATGRARVARCDDHVARLRQPGVDPPNGATGAVHHLPGEHPVRAGLELSRLSLLVPRGRSWRPDRRPPPHGKARPPCLDSAPASLGRAGKPPARIVAMGDRNGETQDAGQAQHLDPVG